jgi:dTDP-4-amino-4,6-dideoxyglucose
MTLPIVRPHHPRLDDIDTYFSHALDTGQVTNQGEWVQRFEEKLTEILGVETICFNSGMSALIAMLRAVDVTDMDVIVPSFTFAATPNAVIMAGGRPIFADIREDTLCLDPVAAERAITGRTTAIMGVDAFGLCWEPPKGWSDGGNIDILIDSAPSFGSDISGENPHTRAKAQIYSFHCTKPFSTMEGGCLCSSDPSLIERAKAIRNFGISNGKVEQIGMNGKMMEICAIIGLKQLEGWPERIAQRSIAASALYEELEDIKGIKLVKCPVKQMPIWTYMPIFIEDKFNVPRDTVVKKLHEKGIMVRKYYEPCHLQPAFQYNPKYPSGHVKLAVTEHIASQVIALPVYSDMKIEEIKEIAVALRSIQKEYA